MKKLFLTAILLLFGCVEPPNINQLKENFLKNEAHFEELVLMIKEVPIHKDDICFSVGLDHIGSSYWKQYSGEWYNNKDYETKLSLDEVLKKVSISQKEYKTYVSFFEKTGTERITYCDARTYKLTGFRDEAVYFLAYRAGLSISGCSVEIAKSPNIPSPLGKKGQGDFSEVTILNKDWWLEYQCT